MKKHLTKNMLTEFRQHLIDDEKSSATLEKYMRDLKTFYLWLNNRKLEKSIVIAYKEYLINNYQTTSVNSMLSSLNSFFVFNGWYALKVKTIKTQKQLFIPSEKELTKNEYERLLRTAYNKKNKRLYYIMQTICASGIRISELQFITVEAVKSKKAEVRCKGKNRTIILPDSLCKILNNYIKERHIKNGCIFITKNGTPVNRSNIWTDMKKLCDEAQVSHSKVFPHNLRHLFARTFYSQQKDIVRLADILGHSNMNTTRIYTIESGDIHRQILQKLDLVCPYI